MDADFLELASQCRAKETQSRYNSAVSVRRCEVCRSTKDLESHHIKHQAVAKNGFVEDGLKTHATSNLTVLCDICHKHHHSGKLAILGWMDTSEGRELRWQLAEEVNSQPLSKIKNTTDDRFDMVK